MPAHRKPDDRHALEGTRPHDRSAVTPTTLVAGRPKFPKGLTPEAKRIFKSLCRQLGDRHTLTEGDGHLIGLYSELWDRRRRAQEKLLVEGEIALYTRLDPNGVAHKIKKPNLHLKVAQDAEKQMVAILDRLGLSPVSGSKVKQTRPTEAAEEAKPGTVAYMILHAKDMVKKNEVTEPN
jgi:P27 family predicted phage terminase small subunit